MDATAQNSKPLHRVKRQYTRKPVSTKEANVRLEGADVAPVVHIEPVFEDVPAPAVSHPDALAYGRRVWSGQSIDLPLSERKERVLNALRGQNLPTDGLVFTAEGIK